MPVTKHKAASCRKFNVVAPRGRDKRGESFSQPLRILWPDSRVKAVYGTGKEKSKSTRLVLGKVQLVRFTLKQRGESRNRLNPRKARFFFLSFSFPLSFSPEGLPPPLPPDASYRCLSRISSAMLCFVSFRFVSLQPRIQWRIFTSVSNYPLAQRRIERREMQFLKFFKI